MSVDIDIHLTAPGVDVHPQTPGSTGNGNLCLRVMVAAMLAVGQGDKGHV